VEKANQQGGRINPLYLFFFAFLFGLQHQQAVGGNKEKQLIIITLDIQESF
jgi:hypothetical protein